MPFVQYLWLEVFVGKILFSHLRNINPIQARLFIFAPAARGHFVPPFENHVPLVLTAYFSVFLKACPKLNHMTHFGFHGNCLSVFKGPQKSFSKKALTKDTAQMALFLVFIESANTKIALCTYLRLTLNGNYVGWAEIRVQREN